LDLGHEEDDSSGRKQGKLMKLVWIIAAAILISLLSSSGSADPKSCVIRQFVTAKNLTSFKPRGITTEFSSKDPWVFGLARLDCLQTKRGEAFQFRWLRDDKEFFKSRAGIGSSRNWRIWSRIKALPGQWKIQLTSMEGHVIAERTFAVQ